MKLRRHSQALQKKGQVVGVDGEEEEEAMPDYGLGHADKNADGAHNHWSRTHHQHRRGKKRKLASHT